MRSCSQTWTRRCLAGLFLTLILFGGTVFVPALRQVYQLPGRQLLTEGQDLEANLVPGLPPFFTARLEAVASRPGGSGSGGGNGNVSGLREVANQPGWSSAGAGPLGGTAGGAGQYQLRVSLFGVLPVRQLAVEMVSPPRVIVSGESIGVVLQTNGVTVVGFSALSSEGREVSPARDQGLLPGDVVLRINGTPVQTNRQAGDLIDRAGRQREKVTIALRRGKKDYSVTLDPVYCPESKRYRVGLLIRDSAAGVGTLTFYDPASGVYGALGHLVADEAGGAPGGAVRGEIVPAVVQGIQEAQRGRPGEKVGLFQEGRGLGGSILKNTHYGIFGHLETLPAQALYRPLPVALLNQVVLGPAELLTVVEGNRVRRFSLMIERVCPGETASGRGLVVRITDPELLEMAGGIVQGMSGSPIIQNGLFAGAVTHVFVNDPTRGYGVPAEWMVQEAGLFQTSVTSMGGASPLPFFLSG